MCPRGGITGLKNEKKGLMHLEMWKKIVNKFLDENVKVDFFAIGNWGEPLLNPLLPDIIRYAKKKLNPKRIRVNTNLNCLKDPIDLLKSGVTEVNVSCSGMTQETYSKNHIGGNIKTVLNNILKLVKIKKELKLDNARLELCFHDYIYNKKEGELAKQFCEKHNLKFNLHRTYVHSVEENIQFHKNKKEWSRFYGKFIDLKNEMSLMRTPNKLKDCWLLSNSIVINFDGELYRCCGVFDQKHFMGSFFDFKIREISKINSKICEECIKTPMSWRTYKKI